jgi:hypothetical protein
VRPPGAENYPEPCPRKNGTERKCGPEQRYWAYWRMTRDGQLRGRHPTVTSRLTAGRSWEWQDHRQRVLRKGESRRASTPGRESSSLAPANEGTASAMQSQANRIKSAWRTLPDRACPYLGSRRQSRLVNPTTKDFTPWLFRPCVYSRWLAMTIRRLNHARKSAAPGHTNRFPSRIQPGPEPAPRQ